MREIAKHPKAIFLGQCVGAPGTTQSDTFAGIPEEKLLEMPVAENMQMGMAIGMALDGWLPVCVYPRWNFLALAFDQLVNHLDKLSIYSNGGYNPRVIIRVATPSVSPFYPGPQHDADFTSVFREALRTIPVVTLQTADAVTREYARAATAPHSTLLMEYTDLYKDKIPSVVKR